MTYFADAFFYVALFNRHDEYHPRVVQWVEGFVGEIVTTQWILTEVADAFSSSQVRRSLRDIFRKLEQSLNTRNVAASPEYFARGMKLYDERPDKEWSLTDCSSLVVMADEGLTEALTHDHHFEQAGFTAVFGN